MNFRSAKQVKAVLAAKNEATVGEVLERDMKEYLRAMKNSVRKKD